MKTIKNFLPKDLHRNLLEYAEICKYRKVEDDIYNFRGCNITGEFYIEVESLFRKHKLVGEIDILRIQRIDKSIRMTENYHRHHTKYKENVVCFLNQNFTGGEFEYIDQKVLKVLPEENTAMVFGPTLRHRVLPVIEGQRYTLVAFLAENSYLHKEQKTLI